MSNDHACALVRLLDCASSYFDLSTFPEGETKRSLQRTLSKKRGKTLAKAEDFDKRDKKRMKKQ